MNKLLTALALLVLSGCTSSPANINYYLLSSPHCCQAGESKTQQWVLQPLQLADYLKQSNLVMQTAPHQLHYSRLDVWSEPISKSITRVLTQQLNQHSAQAQVLASSVPANNALSQYISVQIDDLLPTEKGDVVLRGQYWLHGQQGAAQSFAFSYSMPMQEDGFAHAVGLMYALLEQLAQDISKQLNEV